MSSNKGKDCSLKIISLSDQDDEEESLSSHDDIIQCWQNPAPTKVETDKDEDGSSIEFVQNKKIDLEKLAMKKNFFTPNISVTVQKFLEAKRKSTELQRFV